VIIRRIDEGREAFRELLLLADPEWAVVEKYLGQGEMYALFEGETAVAEALVTYRPDGACELKNLAVDPAFQRKGYARMLVEHVARAMAGRFEKMYVGTSGPKLYERMGFARAYTVENFFVDNYSEPIWDEGELLKDMYYLVRDLKKEERT
jgi:ribosomal protein S18 acetylase RimI-like enzyme